MCVYHSVHLYICQFVSINAHMLDSIKTWVCAGTVVFITCGTVSDAARTALWTCMVEDHQLFFQPFLECFKRDNMTKPKYNEFPVDLTNHQQLVG